MTARTIIALALAFMLNSCSYIYHLRATIIDGQIVFFPKNTDIWGKPKPHCFYSITVSILDGRAATPLPGDDLGMVLNGVYWSKIFANTSCHNRFPVIYGSKLEGPPLFENTEDGVEAKPLLLGHTYEVTTSSDGSSGGVKFRLTEHGTVENLPD